MLIGRSKFYLELGSNILTITHLRSFNWNRIGWVAAIETAVLMIVLSFFLPGGDDLHRYYIPFARGSLDSGFIPYFAQWFTFPLGFLPDRFAWSIWLMVSLVGWLGLCKYTGVNPALVLLTFPAFGQVWLGQIDIIICLGLAIALFGKNPYVRGFGVVLALVKPQLAGIAVIILLTREKELLKVLIVPVVTFATSLLVYGLNWPVEWVTNAIDNLPPHVWRIASGDIWPFGLLLIWIPFIFRDRRESFEAGTLVSAIATPFVGVYSYLIFLVFNRKKWWVIPLSYVWVLAFPFWENKAMRLAWILPVALLVTMVFPLIANRNVVPNEQKFDHAK